jgi:ribonuclease J
METGAVEHAMVIEDGDVLELDKNDARKKDKVTAGRILIDSGSPTT